MIAHSLKARPGCLDTLDVQHYVVHSSETYNYTSSLLTEVRAELLFLLFGQVRLNNLELLTFDGIGNLV